MSKQNHPQQQLLRIMGAAEILTKAPSRMQKKASKEAAKTQKQRSVVR